eukprot:14769094-Alexandrium_andersonii.AAC.1
MARQKQFGGKGLVGGRSATVGLSAPLGGPISLGPERPHQGRPQLRGEALQGETAGQAAGSEATQAKGSGSSRLLVGGALPDEVPEA